MKILKILLKILGISYIINAFSVSMWLGILLALIVLFLLGVLVLAGDLADLFVAVKNLDPLAILKALLLLFITRISIGAILGVLKFLFGGSGNSKEKTSARKRRHAPKTQA